MEKGETKDNYVPAELSFELDNNKLKVYIFTEHLRLESVGRSYTALYHHYLYSKPKVMEKFSTGVTKNYKEVEKLVNAWTNSFESNDPFSTLTVTKHDDDSFVGMTRLGYADQKGASELSYVMNDSYWGKGLGKEAVYAVVKDYAPELVRREYTVDRQPFTTIVATARTDNIPSIKILKGVGMQYTGQKEKFGHLRNNYTLDL